MRDTASKEKDAEWKDAGGRTQFRVPRKGAGTCGEKMVTGFACPHENLSDSSAAAAGVSHRDWPVLSPSTS